MYDNLTRTNLEFAYQKTEKRIAELEKENAELKERCDCEKCYSLVRAYRNDNEKLKEQLTKAKEIIKELLDSYKYVIRFREYADKKPIAKAEQFLKEIEK